MIETSGQFRAKPCFSETIRPELFDILIYERTWKWKKAWSYITISISYHTPLLRNRLSIFSTASNFAFSAAPPPFSQHYQSHSTRSKVQLCLSFSYPRFSSFWPPSVLFTASITGFFIFFHFKPSVHRNANPPVTTDITKVLLAA
jgi:hypothetical protein